MKKQKHKYVLFWIKSSRGTDEMSVQKYPASITEEEIKDDLENWCANFGAWTQSHVNYGFKFVKNETRPVLLARWERLCKQKNDLEKRWKELRARLNPLDWTRE